MDEVFVNDPGTTLASSCNSSVTTITVTSAAGYPTTRNFRIQLGTELMLVTGVSGTTWTVTRGIEGTAAASHTAGDDVNAIATAGALEVLRSEATNLLSPESRWLVSQRFGAKQKSSKGKNVSAAAAGSTTVINITGEEGYLSDFWMASDVGSETEAEQIMMTITVDGNVLFSDIAAIYFGCLFFVYQPQNFANDFNQCWGGNGMKTTIPIPFGSSLEITFTNNTSRTVHYWWTLGYTTGIPPSTWGNLGKLNTAYQATSAAVQDQLVTLANLSGLGPGMLLGSSIWWANTGGASSAAFLEGAIEITLDGVSACLTSGAEDYYGMAGYFASVSPGAGDRFQTLTIKDAAAKWYAAQRFHVREPMTFADAFKMTVAAGDSSGGLPTFTGSILVLTLLFYYTAS